MLKQLHIQNYAIIDDIVIDFSEKLNIITGETGAGKSILAGALALILGERADTSVLLHRDKKCYVEGIFLTENKNEIKIFLEENDLDADEELVIRREIGSNGKSRAFVNDTPVNLDQLRQLSWLLVDLHQQFDTLELSDSGFQREVLDALAGHAAILNKYQLSYQQLITVRKELQLLQEKQTQADKEADYNRYLFNELAEANFEDEELEKLNNELKLLNNSEAIKNTLSKVYYDLTESEQPVVQQLKLFLNQLQTYSSYHSALPNIITRLQSAQVELRDIASELEHLNDQVQYDPKRIEFINERISAGYRLLKKHNVQSTGELLILQRDLETKLKAVLDIAERINTKEKETAALLEQTKLLAVSISNNRHAQVKKLEQQVNELLIQVGMPNARLKVQIKEDELNYFGMDAVEFLFDANKSNRFEPIRKVASGGELSRLMLCIKSLIAKSMDLPTLFFDEIDSGISGEAAKQVGIILKDLSKKRQVICITHQPQIAGKADAHYFVYKEIGGEMIKTNIRLLTGDERVIAIAKMLSGEKPTAAALENAKEMVSN
ncbi:MAG: DNA repair protein RecN [Bacteroidetes bacterium]|nr:DNA repair protein RecN [Bacteroidota bacterium]